MISKKVILLFLCAASISVGWSQKGYELLDSVSLGGKIFSAIVQDGDTMILAQLDDVNFSSPRSFDSRDEYKRYLRYKKYATEVYPYALDAIKILKTVESRTEHMNKRKRKKYIKQTYEQLEHNFQQQLKSLTRTQGKILIKMIEKEVDDSFYNIVKEKRNRFTAFYWHQFGKLYDYDLKRGYIRGDDLIMDAVLDGFDLSYDKKSTGKLLSN